jgi:hypothetical protein
MGQKIVDLPITIMNGKYEDDKRFFIEFHTLRLIIEFSWILSHCVPC